VSANAYVQRNQPPGVPPLELTGERTLPDVPAENYWYRRHLAVYEWVAARVAGLRVLDMACGEGYGAALLARVARSVVGVDANPEAYEHARLRYRAANLHFERGLAESYGSPGAFDAVVFLQTIEHVQDPEAVLAHLAALLAPGGTAYVSTPNVLTLAPAGAARSDNPWHLREYQAEEFEALCRSAFAEVELLGLHHARKLRAHELALRLGWDRLHTRLRISKRFYERFTPAIAARDFALLPARGRRPAAPARERRPIASLLLAPPGRPLERALDFLAVCRATCGSQRRRSALSASIQSPQRNVFGASRMRMTRAGTPPTTALSGTSRVHTAFVPITELSPTLTPRRMQAP
jgi:2-polyprenyl-3-methyl-5-hydroxy-6-metoxy-1,4-benzoquinol methylase